MVDQNLPFYLEETGDEEVSGINIRRNEKCF